MCHDLNSNWEYHHTPSPINHIKGKHANGQQWQEKPKNKKNTARRSGKETTLRAHVCVSVFLVYMATYTHVPFDSFECLHLYLAWPGLGVCEEKPFINMSRQYMRKQSNGLLMIFIFAQDTKSTNGNSNNTNNTNNMCHITAKGNQQWHEWSRK